MYFDATVTSATALDGFTVQGHDDTANAAITVDGSTGAIVTNDLVLGGAGTTSYGVDVLAGGTPTISLDQINGGTGSTTAIGVHSLGSAPVVQNNCTMQDTSGRCTSGCSNTAGTKFIRARQSGSGTNGYGVWLEMSPNAVVDVNGICAGQGPGGAGPLSGDSAGVRIVGDATGVLVRANNVFAGGASMNAVGVWADPCGGASPWVVDNVQISGNSPVMGARADGVRAVGDCPMRVDSNARIVGGIESANNDANGVFCARDAATGTSSACTVLNNAIIQGSGGGFPPRAVGVRCDDGACARIQNNASISGQSGNLAYGVVLGATGTFVDSNHISAGCGRMEGDGILTLDSYARIQNNVIEGSQCAAGGAAPMVAYGVHEQIGGGMNEVDLHSNTVLARGAAGACTSAALVVEPLMGATPTGPWGIVRNDILHPGLCTTRYDVLEAAAGADPRILENDDLWFQAAGDVLYRDEGATDITAIASVNALTDITAGMCISVDPMLDATFHLMTGSMCVDTGTATGAPATDFEGDARPTGPGYDIGADEH